MRAPLQDEVLKPIMEGLLRAEQALLYTLEFDLRIEHPYASIVKALKDMGIRISNHMTSEEKKVFQLAVNMCNDRCVMSCR